jgi:phage tail-like protein
VSMPEPGIGLRFTVVIDGHQLGNWQKCEGLSVSYDIEEYKEGGLNGYVHRIPGRVKYETIKLTRPVDPTSSQVAAWVATIQSHTTRGTAQISVLDATGKPVTTYSLSGVFPSKYSGPNLDIGSNVIAMESLELIHNGFLGPG